MRRHFLLVVGLAATVAAPALEQTVASAGEPTGSVTSGTGSIPDFSHVWMHPAFPWFEPPASGPGPVADAKATIHPVAQSGRWDLNPRISKPPTWHAPPTPR